MQLLNRKTLKQFRLMKQLQIIAKITEGTTLLKQFLDNLLFKMLYF